MVGLCDYRATNKIRHAPVENEEHSEKKPGFRLWSSGPNFDTDLPQDVSGVVGQTAYLTCRVFDRTNKTVSSHSSSSKTNMLNSQISWIRHSDLHILTVGRYTYTADNRYQSIYNPTTDEWILQVGIDLNYYSNNFVK